MNLLGDLELHVKEEIDPKISKEVFKRICAILQKMRVRPILVSQNWTFAPTVLDQIVVGQIYGRSVIVLSVRPNQRTWNVRSNSARPNSGRPNVRPILVKLDVRPIC
ncbi:hypothetical protein LR48_Vigan03g260200 [Vigna angularis]|uniref:Uncharacterized protein n=1 Tax=Phaseolus angularis TaxID=3914 RepID=A0A0L9U8Q7_PHAAN|nr:hypothetical protein LR48_Vigan03g260200 [Vigna angularis]